MSNIFAAGLISSVAMIINQELAKRKQIESALQKSHAQLEIQVKNRTAELVKANDDLTDEITQRKQVEQALQETTTLQRAILNSANYTIICTSLDGKIVTFNAAAERLLRYTAQEVVGKTPVIFHDLDEVVQQAQKLSKELGFEISPSFEVFVAKARQGEPEEREWTYIRKDGSRFPVLLSVTAVRDAQDNITGFLGIGSDITQRKQAESTLRESEERFKLFMNNSPALAFIKDEQGRYLYINQPFERIFNLKLTDFYGQTDYALMPEATAMRVREDDKRVIAANTTVEILEIVPTPDGCPHYWLTFKFPIENSGQRLLGGVAFDITERHQADEALYKEKEFLKAVLNNIQVGIVACDAQGGLTLFNPATREMHNLPEQQLCADQWAEHYDLYHPDGRTPLQKQEIPLFRALQGERVHNQEIMIVTKQGKAHTVLVNGQAIVDPNGKKLGAVVAIHDITERQQVELALKQANVQLKGWVNELSQRNREIALLGEISEFMQACLSVEEAYTVLGKLVQPLFPQTEGGIFLISASKNLVEAVATWGSRISTPEIFMPDECWALRRGRLHRVEGDDKICCQHYSEHSLPAESLCIPMAAQGEAMGILYLASFELGRLTQTQQQLAVTVAEQIALSLANLRMHSTLKNQSIRDPLTGLFNRCYMEEILEREMHRCLRKQQPLSIIMIDVDHFKRFNDTFGHEAGNIVLRELSHFLQSSIRNTDIACRYGGEELMLILPETSLEVSINQAEQLRQAAKQLSVYHSHQLLDAIALSLGVACFPEHGSTPEDVIRLADQALYHAKKSGRDRVFTATDLISNTSLEVAQII